MVINMSGDDGDDGDDVVCSDDGQWHGLPSVRPPAHSSIHWMSWNKTELCLKGFERRERGNCELLSPPSSPSSLSDFRPPSERAFVTKDPINVTTAAAAACVYFLAARPACTRAPLFNLEDGDAASGHAEGALFFCVVVRME